MKKVVFWISCFNLIITISSFSSCRKNSEEITPTTISIASQRYVHLNRNVGDVHPVFLNNQLYMYYLKTGGTYQSSLLTSSDLLSFTDRTISTDPQARPWSVLYVFKRDSNNDYISYHSTDGVFPNGILRGSESRDLITWQQMPNEFTVPQPQRSYYNLKDPYVFHNADQNNYWAVRSGKETQNGSWSFLYWTSTDLTNWQDKGTLFAPGDIYGPIECPQMFKIGNYWYILYSEYTGRVGKPQYFYSSQPEGPWMRPAGDNSLDGRQVCAAQVVSVNNKWLLYGWIPSKDEGSVQEWGGSLCLARELVQLPDGRLVTRIAPQVSSLIRGAKVLQSTDSIRLSSDSSSPASKMISVKNAKFDWSMNFDITAPVGSVGTTIDVGEGVSPKKIDIEFANGSLIIKSGATIFSSIRLPLAICRHTLRIISDKDIIEVFVDDQYSLAAMVATDVVNASLSIYVNVGNVIFSSIQVNQLNNIVFQ